MRILRICEFLEPFVVARNTTGLEAYGPELLQELMRNLPLLDPEGTSPPLFDRIMALLAGIQSISRDVFQRNECGQMRDITSSLRDRSLRYAVERPGDGLLEYPALAPKSSSSAWVPMLETEPLLTQRPPQFALLREFTIELSPRDSASNEDMIFLDQSTDPDGRHRDVIAHALTVARRLFEKHTGQSAGTSFNVHCRFNEPGIVIGESMGLAAAAATFCELLRVSQSRQQVTLSSRVAFTGTLSEDGTAMPVDEVGLRLKLEACIYSHVSHVVLPKSQLTVAEALFSHPTYASIRGALPILIAIERLEEVFYDRRISNVIRVPLYRVLAKNVWRFRRSVAVALILLLGAMLAYEILGPFDKNPQFGEFKDKWLIVNNRHHEELAQFDVGGEIVKAANDPAAADVRRGACQFYDVDGDGTNEVFFRSGKGGDRISAMIVCRSIKKSGVQWQKSITRKLSFPHKPDVESEDFSVTTFLVGEFDGDGRPEVILVANHTFFPSLIVKLDARTGDELCEYLHIGQLGGLNAADLDGDGVPEIIACGVNNAYRKAAVVVLDARTMEGCSPTRGDYFPEPYVPAREKAYILIPRTIAGEAVGALTANNGASSVQIDGQSKKIVIQILDFNLDLPQFSITPNADLFYYFDYALRPIRVGTSNHYDLMVERMVRLGWLKKAPDKAYFDEYLKTIEYWDGQKFVASVAK